MAEGSSLTFYDIFDQFQPHWRSWHDWKNTSWFTKMNYVNFFMLVTFFVLAIYQARTKAVEAQGKSASSRSLPAPGFPAVEEYQDFLWEKEEPLKLRTFKPKFHLTMALQKLDPSELILMDKDYASRIEYRKEIMKDYHDVIICVNDDSRVRGAVQEHYNFLMGTYLPKRYPTMFKLHLASFETGDAYMLENLVTKAMLPAKVDQSANTTTLLKNLCQTFDEDFLFLVAEDVEEGKESEAKYVLEACVVVCPSGWNPQEKIGNSLATIHAPVPGYSKILEASMDRYFNKVQSGEYIQRTNWGITVHEALFSPHDGSNHAHEGDDITELETIEGDKTYLRCERQTLHRLPKSKVMVFAFKTYMYPLSDIKAEGLGEDLAVAVDGLKKGNVPSINFYKRGVAWGGAVKRYLRS